MDDHHSTTKPDDAFRFPEDIYTEMPSDAIRAELTKLPWITEGSLETGEKDSAPNCAPLFGAKGQSVSERGKSASGRDASEYVDSPLKRRVLAALDTLRQNLEMVDATGLEPVGKNGQGAEGQAGCASAKSDNAQLGAQDSAVVCHELAEIAERWSSVSAEVRKAILTLLRAAKEVSDGRG